MAYPKRKEIGENTGKLDTEYCNGHNDVYDDFTEELKERCGKEIESIIGICIGQASMQWEFCDRGGVFQSDDACKLLDETVDKITKHILKGLEK